MIRLLSLLFLLAAAGCATDDDAAGTSNPEVATPVEVAPALGAPPADSAAADTAR